MQQDTIRCYSHKLKYIFLLARAISIMFFSAHNKVSQYEATRWQSNNQSYLIKMLQVFDIYLYVWRKRLCDFRIYRVCLNILLLLFMSNLINHFFYHFHSCVIWIFQKYVFQAQEGKAPYPWGPLLGGFGLRNNALRAVLNGVNDLAWFKWLNFLNLLLFIITTSVVRILLCNITWNLCGIVYHHLTLSTKYQVDLVVVRVI